LPESSDRALAAADPHAHGSGRERTRSRPRNAVRLAPVSTRLLGVGLAAGLAAVTLALALTDRLALYINPSSNPFAISMAVILLVGVVASFALPLGSEADHGHDHDHDHGHGRGDVDGHGHGDGDADATGRTRRTLPVATIAVGAWGVLATGIVAAIVLVPPASLSAELAMSRDTGSPPLFQGADTVALAAVGDTASFGIGEWASVFATATNPEAFSGDDVVLTGFVAPGDDGFSLVRLVITHCVIDAQPASIPVSDGVRAEAASWDTGQWVTVEGTIRDVDGRLLVEARSVEAVPEPKDPYEY
jgi:uncharacterized repeat protein (TIGR03943 family)